MYYLGLLLFLCSTAFSQIEYSENQDASVVAVHGSANGAFMITAGELLQFYWSTEEGTTECTSPTTLTLAVSTVIFDVHVEGDILSLLLLSNNRLHIVTFVVTDLGLDYVCTGYQDWTDKVMKGKPMWAYFLPGTDSETASSGNLFAYSDTKRVLVFMSYTLVGGQIVTGWNVTESLITVDQTVGIENGPINDYATPRFSYDATQNLVVYLDKSGKVYTADVSRVLAKQDTFTNIVFNPDTHNVQKVLEIRLEPSLKSLMLSVLTSTCESAMLVLDYTTSAPGALSFNTIDTDCTTRLPLSDGNNFYYQSSKDLYQVQGGTSSVYFSTNDATVIYDYEFYAPGKALVITKNQNTFVCNIYSVEASQQSTPFTAIPFLSTELFKWQMVYDSTGGLKGALFWTTVATIYGYGFGDANYEVTLALDNPKDFTVINLQDEDAGILASRSYLAIAEGSDQGIELFVTIFWDYSNLVLPIVNGTTKDSFYFPDFITALTRVKNEVSSIFSSYIDLGDVSAIDEWSPELWEPYPGGLSLNITFTQGETDEKITTILTSMANEIGVTVERECEFQDFLSCDVLTLWHSYAPESETLTTNGVVTFYVNGVCSALPSMLALFVVTVLYTLVSF